MKEVLSIGITVAVVTVFLFLIFRELNNWYWKINERIALQKENNDLLRKISAQLSAKENSEENI